jgi:hypothetical protein
MNINAHLQAGLSIIPISNKIPTIKSWSEYQTRVPRPDELVYHDGYALICGKVSGNIEVLDIDVKHDPEKKLLTRLKETIGPEFFSELQQTIVIQSTPSGGYHFIYRCETIAGNKKLAKTATGEVILETRGEGGYVAIAPTPGYVIKKGDLLNIPTITPEQRTKLFDCCNALNEHFEPAKDRISKKVTDATNGIKSWDAYNQQCDIATLLEKHGWSFVKQHGPVDFWKRPGNTTSVHSASFHRELNTFYVYTSSVPQFEQGHAYTPYAVLTKLEYDGDYSKCAKALWEQGYGITSNGISRSNGTHLPQHENDAPKVLTKNQKLEVWLNERYEFRKNIITNTTISREKPDCDWQECNENDIWRAIQNNISDFGKGKRGGEVSIPLSDICSLLDSDFVPKFNPFTHYFNNLPTWDGTTDHIAELASYIQTDNQDFWVTQFKKALVRSVAGTLSGAVNRIVMTLVGETQESGKSTYIRFLCPPDLRAYYKEEPLLHEKDSEIALAENFIWNLEELDDLNKKQISEMKAIISRESIKHRRAYARRESSMKRIVNFWGSTNKTEFLTDTQNTRWLCFNVISINHDYNNTTTGVRKIDINKVWAQAHHLFKSNFHYHLSESDRIQRDHSNKSFESMPEEKQLIIRHFRPGKPLDNESEFLENIKIKQVLDNLTNSKTRLFEQNIGRALSQLGYISQRKAINGKQMRGWYVIILKNQADFDEHAVLAQQEEFPF